MKSRAQVIRVERTTALDMVDIARALMRRDSSWGTETFPFADGHAVLFGSGLYVNRVLGAGLERDTDEKHLDRLTKRSQIVGVTAAIEVSEYTLPSVVSQLEANGFQAGSQTAVMIRPLNGDLPESDPTVEVESVGTNDVPTWQSATAEGWGHTTSPARRASDAFAAAAAEVQTPGLLLARSTRDGRVLGCASLSLRDGVATLGGMSTLPAERGQGVQSALIACRLRLAADADCTIALTEVSPNSQSQRNLNRHGFRHSHTKTTWAR